MASEFCVGHIVSQKIYLYVNEALMKSKTIFKKTLLDGAGKALKKFSHGCPLKSLTFGSILSSSGKSALI